MRRSVSFTIRLLISVFFLGLVLSQVDLSQFFRLVIHAKLHFIALSLTISACCRLVIYYRITLLLHSKDVHIRYWDVVKIYWMCDFGSFFMPGLIGGDVLRTVGLRHYLQSTNKAASSVFVERFIGMFSLLALALMSMIVCRSIFYNASLFYLIIVILILCVSTVTILFVYPSFVKQLLERFFSHNRFVRKIGEIIDAIIAYEHHKTTLLGVFVLCVIVHILRIVNNYCILLALGVHVSITYFFLFMPLIFFVVMLPISIGGFGVKEGAFVYLFAFAGVQNTAAFTLSLLGTVLNIIITLPGALIFLQEGFLIKQKVHQEKEDSAAP